MRCHTRRSLTETALLKVNMNYQSLSPCSQSYITGTKCAAFLASLALSATALSQTTVYTDQASLLAAASGTLYDLDTEPLGPVSNPWTYGPFQFTSTGLPGTLEIAPPDTFWSTRYLNPGQRPFESGDGDNDSIDIQLTTPGFRAFGFAFVDGSLAQESESVTFFDQGGNILYQHTSAQSTTSYIGITASVDIERIVVIEGNNDSDDVGYDDFFVGTPVPEPGTFAGLCIGALVLLSVRKFSRRAC